MASVCVSESSAPVPLRFSVTVAAVSSNAIDNVLRPWLIQRGAKLPFLLVLGGVIGGLLAFGVAGIFIGPILLAVVKRLMERWAAEK